MMVRAEEIVAGFGADMDGVVTDDVLDVGVERYEVEGMRRRGLLVHVGRGIDRLRDHPVTWRTRCRIALAVGGPGAVLGRRSAARLHGFYAYRDTDEVEVLVPRGGDHRSPEGRIVETRWLPPEHVTVVDGLPVTTMARTFFDLCGNPEFGLKVGHPAHEQAMIRVYNDALGRRGMTFTQEVAVLLVMAKRGRNGTRLVRKILKRFEKRYVPTRSDTETLFLELLHAYAVSEPEKQVAMSDEHGFIGVVDFVWQRAMVVVEVDSSWHDGPLDQEVDEERDARLRAAGYAIERYRYGDLVDRPAAIARKLAVIVGSID